NITYTLKVQNNGLANATGVTITDPLPSSVQFVSASVGCSFASGTVTCNIGNLAIGDMVTRTLTVKVIGAGPINNTATVTGNEVGATCTKAQTVTCNFPTINSGETKVVWILVKAPVPGTIFNTATVTSDVPDPHPDNNSAQAVTTVKE